MAYGVKISAISRETGNEVFTLEPSWWSADQLIKEPGFRVSNETGSYFDYDADVSIEEMKRLHEIYKQNAVKGVYGTAQWQEINKPVMNNLEEAINSGSDVYSHFHITVFEWESGY